MTGGLERFERADTREFLIFVAGDLPDIRRACREFCMEGLCVSVEPTSFIYTAGAEEGALVRLLNYPRFQKNYEELEAIAIRLARHLRIACCQASVLVQAPGQTTWITTRPEDQ